MKVDRSNFNYAIAILETLNYEELNNLDLSDWFDMESEEYKKRVEEWKFMGLSNKDFILMNDDIWKEQPK
jgi:hypothetical protein